MFKRHDAYTNTPDARADEDGGFGGRHRAARDLARGRARVERVHPGIHEAVEAHGGASRRNHRHAGSTPTTGQVIGTTRDARSAPASANGRANTEWLKRTNDR